MNKKSKTFGTIFKIQEKIFIVSVFCDIVFNIFEC
jgi:hypothetical protein